MFGSRMQASWQRWEAGIRLKYPRRYAYLEKQLEAKDENGHKEESRHKREKHDRKDKDKDRHRDRDRDRDRGKDKDKDKDKDRDRDRKSSKREHRDKSQDRERKRHHSSRDRHTSSRTERERPRMPAHVPEPVKRYWLEATSCEHLMWTSYMTSYGAVSLLVLLPCVLADLGRSGDPYAQDCPAESLTQ